MTDFENGETQPNMPIESADDSVLKQLSKMSFLNNPELQITLPSGKTIGSEEAQAFASLFKQDTDESDVPK